MTTYAAGVSVVLVSGTWASPLVLIADSRRARRRGLRPKSQGRAILLGGSTVHGFGMQESLWAVGIDDAGRVTEVRLLRPRRIVRLRGAHSVLELPAWGAPPPAGARLSVTPD